MKDFDLVSSSIAEYEKRVREWIELEREAHYRSEAVDALSHVCRPAGKVDAIGNAAVQHMDATTRRTSVRIDGSKPGRTSTRALPIAMTIGELDSAHCASGSISDNST